MKKDSVVDWRIDQILTSDLFGLESARSEEVQKILNRRKELILKGNLTKTEKTELERLNKQAAKIPNAETPAQIKAMQLIMEVADELKQKK